MTHIVYMKSHEILKETIAEYGVKALAADMGVSQSLLYKWMEPHEGPEDAGTINPLDRVTQIAQITNSASLVKWLAGQQSGFFVENPSSEAAKTVLPLKAVQTILHDFSELLEVVSSSLDDDTIDNLEADTIRRQWDDLKSKTESFVQACEAGHYIESNTIHERDIL